jgi:hypothetical protein
MDIREHLKFKLAGFSSARVGYVLAAISFCLAPVNFFVSFWVSGVLGDFSLFVVAITLAFSFSTPQTTPHRFRPAIFASFAFIANMFGNH